MVLSSELIPCGTKQKIITLDESINILNELPLIHLRVHCSPTAIEQLKDLDDHLNYHPFVSITTELITTILINISMIFSPEGVIIIAIFTLTTLLNYVNEIHHAKCCMHTKDPTKEMKTKGISVRRNTN